MHGHTGSKNGLHGLTSQGQGQGPGPGPRPRPRARPMPRAQGLKPWGQLGAGWLIGQSRKRDSKDLGLPRPPTGQSRIRDWN